MLPEYKGSYKAQPHKCCVSKSKNGAVELAVEFACFEFWNGEAWEGCNSDIIGRFYLVTKAGQINEKTVATVEDVFGWDRRQGTAWFAANPELPLCQVACDFEEYEGKQVIKVKWLNAIDREPNSGVGACDLEEIKSIDGQFGGLFRSTARKPAPPANGNSSGKTPIANAVDLAKREAWDAFKATKGPGEPVADLFKAAVSDYFQGQDPKTLSTANWKQFRADKFARAASPISDVPEFEESSIPF